jgi:hypothetical protein
MFDWNIVSEKTYRSLSIVENTHRGSIWGTKLCVGVGWQRHEFQVYGKDKWSQTWRRDRQGASSCWFIFKVSEVQYCAVFTFCLVSMCPKMKIKSLFNLMIQRDIRTIWLGGHARAWKTIQYEAMSHGMTNVRSKNIGRNNFVAQAKLQTWLCTSN